jgi:predicted nucleotide-binding protein (sugar kinase/HSP70/actin superfamily)
MDGGKEALKEGSNSWPVFTKEMKQRHTILAPQMAPIHFELIQEAARSEGYLFEILTTVEREDIEVGLKYVNNDSCYPSIIIVGQFLRALQSGKYDLSNTSLVITQTGGPCRASNYLGLLKRALKAAGFENIPIISLNVAGLQKNPGFRLTAPLCIKAIRAIIYGDLLMKVLFQTRPYETVTGTANKLFKGWMEECKKNMHSGNRKEFRENLKKIVEQFEQIPVCSEKKPRVGLVGEILVKYHPYANNNMVPFVEEAGAEMVVPGFTEFFLYSASNGKFRHRYLADKKTSKLIGNLVVNYIEHYRDDMRAALKDSKRYNYYWICDSKRNEAIL